MIANANGLAKPLCRWLRCEKLNVNAVLEANPPSRPVSPIPWREPTTLTNT